MNHHPAAVNSGSSLPVRLLTFGFKHGPPPEADMVLDVRFLPNPYWVEELRSMTGLDQEAARHVLDNDPARRFLARLLPLLDFLLPMYRESGRERLTIAFGCTGGRHRSVAVAAAIARHLEKNGWQPHLSHRDLEKQ